MPKAFPAFFRFLRGPALWVFLVCMGLSSWIIWNLEQNQRQTSRTHLEKVAQSHSFLVRNSINQALTLNYSLAALVRLTNGTPQRFDEVARELLNYFPGVSHVSLSPGGVITKVYPLEGNEKSVGFNQLQDVQQNREAIRARDTGKLTLAGPVNLVQGGLGVVARLPVFLNGEDGPYFWGFTNVIIRIESLLGTTNLQQLEERGIAYRLWRIDPDTGAESVIAEYAPEHLITPSHRQFEVPNGYWTLSLAPIAGWTNPWQLIIKTIIAFIWSLLLAYLACLLAKLQESKQTLESTVAQRTSEANAARSQLQATLDAIPDLLFEIGSDHVIYTFHTRRRDLLLLPPEEFLGKKFTEFLSADVNQIIIDAMAEAEAMGLSEGKCYTLNLPDGRHEFELSVSRKAEQQDGITHFVLLSRDITERRHAEEELRVAATAFEAREAMMVTDADSVILRVNKAFCDSTGYSAEEVIGKTPRILDSGHHDEAFYSDMWLKITTEGNWKGEIWNRRHNGDIFPEWLTITAVKDQRGNITHFVSTLTDISERKEIEARINNLAFFDPLTQLPNRRLLQDRLEHAIATSLRQQTFGALLFIDLDDFKTLNDNRGHHFGDMLLIAVADRLRLAVRAQDTVARLGGDEFLVVLEGLDKERDEAAAQAQYVTEKILKVLNQPYHLDDQDYFITPSIGICLFGNRQEFINELMKQADQAMYHAKAAGRNTFRFFDPEMQAVTAQRFSLQHEIREALLQQQFQLYYQPQVNQHGAVDGVEALIRWMHPERGMVSPMDFIPIAEESGLIIPMGQWIVETACRQLVNWQSSPLTAGLTISINVSARQFQHPQFVEQLLEAIAITGANPAKLKLELTESMLVANPQEIITKMDELIVHGINFSLDDFGTGYSSLSYLKRLPINELKIDKSFVNDILTDPNDAAIARMIIRLAQSMELTVIAEGVETREQRDWLEQEGCFKYQGYYFAKPMPAAKFNLQSETII